ncbi:hypothetical protein BCR35DRAFT_298899 [Leucosporidium creatinivorum]|uniref:ferric-chelate reductase (NADPH) n=1 Tax=Leucosporidium creatinivorum TaxID=106004 RepID=A0A1Y2G4C4_9BASI|nr:hypothetical protein BCR35DRAFT_298899 [Leucosporidium creatinivorum]
MGVAQSIGALGLPLMLNMRYERTCDETLTEEQCAWGGERWRNWYIADYVYGQGLVYFASTVLGFFTLLHLLQLLRHRRAGNKAVNFFGYRSFFALARAAFGRQYRVGGYYTATSGVIALILAFIVFSAGISLGPKPYYWPETGSDFLYGSSPPLATRSGWLALAMLPFLVILASKANPITLFTGVSHEKLQVLHHWVSWIMFVLSLLHTFPFIVIFIHEGVMESQWAMNKQLWTGVLCLVPQTVMMILSLGPIRNRYYEMFKTFHLILAMLFIVTLFIHCDSILTSWWYFIALAVVYISSLIYRWSIATFRNGFSRRAQVHVLDSSLLRLDIPTSLKWSPGQHYFFRFLLGEGDLHRFTSHPFTVASVPEDGKIELIVKVRDGITLRLAELESVPVVLDGPYGGLQGKMEAFAHVLLMAGGSGGSFILSIFRHLLALKETSVKSITVVYSTRSTELLKAFSTALSDAQASTNFTSSTTLIDLHLHLTGSHSSTPSLCASSSAEKEADQSSPAVGRPSLGSFIAKAAVQEGSLAVAVCGPPGMGYDARKEVAEVQMGILRGKQGVSECWLHSEEFRW